MPQTRDPNNAWFALSGPDCAPEERGFAGDPPAERARYWKELARLMFEERRSELFKGLGVDGHRLSKRKDPRRDGATGPVLIPHFSASRFSTKMSYAGEPDRAVVTWDKDWVVVVAGHASGRATGTVRDVCGLTPSGIVRVVKQARKWWAGQKRHVPWYEQGDTVGMPVPAGARQVGRTFTAADLAPEGPVPTPPILSGTPTHTTHQQFEEVFRAATRAQLDQRQIAQTVARLAFLTTPELVDLAKRVGIIPAPSDRATLLELLRRTLVQRQLEAERLLNRKPPQPPSGGTPPPNPPSSPPKPSAPPKPKPPAPVAAQPTPTPTPTQPPAPAPEDNVSRPSYGQYRHAITLNTHVGTKVDALIKTMVDKGDRQDIAAMVGIPNTASVRMDIMPGDDTALLITANSTEPSGSKASFTLERSVKLAPDGTLIIKHLKTKFSNHYNAKDWLTYSTAITHDNAARLNTKVQIVADKNDVKKHAAVYRALTDIGFETQKDQYVWRFGSDSTKLINTRVGEMLDDMGPTQGVVRNKAIKRAVLNGNMHGVYTKDTNRKKTYIGGYYQTLDLIEIETTHAYWDDPQKVQTKEFLKGYFSSDAFDHIITHELGHAFHYRNFFPDWETKSVTDRTAIYQQINAAIPADMEQLIKSKVSEYALKNNKEVVAEMYAGMKSGKVYDKELMDLYRKYKGSEP